MTNNSNWENVESLVGTEEESLKDETLEVTEVEDENSTLPVDENEASDADNTADKNSEQEHPEEDGEETEGEPGQEEPEETPENNEASDEKTEEGMSRGQKILLVVIAIVLALLLLLFGISYFNGVHRGDNSRNIVDNTSSITSGVADITDTSEDDESLNDSGIEDYNQNGVADSKSDNDNATNKKPNKKTDGTSSSSTPVSSGQQDDNSNNGNTSKPDTFKPPVTSNDENGENENSKPDNSGQGSGNQGGTDKKWPDYTGNTTVAITKINENTAVVTVTVDGESIMVPIQTTVFNGRVTKSGVAQGKMFGFNVGATVVLFYPQNVGMSETEYSGYMSRTGDSLTILVDINGEKSKLLIKINGFKTL